MAAAAAEFGGTRTLLGDKVSRGRIFHFNYLFIYSVVLFVYFHITTK